MITQKQVPTIQKIQKTVERPQVQFEGALTLQRVQWTRCKRSPSTKCNRDRKPQCKL